MCGLIFDYGEMGSVSTANQGRYVPKVSLSPDLEVCVPLGCAAWNSVLGFATNTTLLSFLIMLSSALSTAKPIKKEGS